MQFLSADYIFPITSPPLKNGILVTEDDGTIVELVRNNSSVPDFKTEYSINEIRNFSGILCPGFVNAHCHLELSYLKNHIQPHTGLTGFINELISKRNSFSEQQIADAIKLTDNEMHSNGTVAVGDISNTIYSLQTKSKSKIYYHTFIEIFDLIPEKAEEAFSNGSSIQSSFIKGQSSITPHAPYSVSEKLFDLIKNYASNRIITIHNQETESENELFRNKSGKLFEFFLSLGINLSHINQTGKTSLQSYSEKLSANTKTLFVHNTFTTEEDIVFAKNYFDNACWCFCPNANLYIEDTLPYFNLFVKNNCNITLGTDSYASNTSLSILEEIKAVLKNSPSILFENVLQWATINGAKFFGIENQFGSFEKGKKPGIVLIEGFNEGKISESSTSKRVL